MKDLEAQRAKAQRSLQRKVLCYDMSLRGPVSSLSKKVCLVNTCIPHKITLLPFLRTLLCAFPLLFLLEVYH